MVIRKARPVPAVSRLPTVQRTLAGASTGETAAAPKPVTLYLVGSAADAGRPWNELEGLVDGAGRSASTDAQVLAVGTAGRATLNDGRLQVFDLRLAGAEQPGAMDQPSFMP